MEADEKPNRVWHWMDGNACGRKVLAIFDRVRERYARHVIRYHAWNSASYRIRTWLVAVVAGLAILAALAGTCRLGLRHYRRYQEQRWTKEAQVFLAHSDYRDAALSARKVLTLNPNNLQACHIMETLADMAHSPVALDWQRHIVQIEPSIENQLMLAGVGLQYQSPPFPLTTQILQDLAHTATNNVAYHVVAAQLALSLNQLAEAKTHLGIATRLDPTNHLFALNLATVRLASTNETEAAQGRAELEKFLTDPNLKLSALRSLVADRLAHKDFAAANSFSTQLLANTEANLGDHLQQLGILLQLKSADFNDSLATLQHDAATNALTAAQVAAWMQSNGLVRESLEWLTGLPNPLLDQRPVQMALAQGYLQTSQWTKLLNTVSQSNWLDLEFLRLALVYRAWSQLGSGGLADTSWNAALGAAAGHPAALTQLLQLAGGWRLPQKQEAVLFQMVQDFPNDRAARLELERMYFNSGNTLGLHALYAVLDAKFPNDPSFENNLAATALLLNQNVEQARQRAANLHAKHPADPIVASTYAFALHLQGRDKQGLAVLQQFPPAELAQPSVALYYGVLLEAAGQTNQAAPWLKIARTNSLLLPEEKELLSAVQGKGQASQP
jgi:hypothetical protein